MKKRTTLPHHCVCVSVWGARSGEWGKGQVVVVRCCWPELMAESMLLQTAGLQLESSLSGKHTEKQYCRPGIRFWCSFFPRECNSWGGREDAKIQRSQTGGREGEREEGVQVLQANHLLQGVTSLDHQLEAQLLVDGPQVLHRGQHIHTQGPVFAACHNQPRRVQHGCREAGDEA